MVAWPVLAAAGLGLRELWRGQVDDGDGASDVNEGDGNALDGGDMSGPNDGSEFFGWRYPMASWRGYQPEISSGFGPRNGRMHNGVDIMFHRKTGGADQMFGMSSSQGTPHFFCPDNLDCLAPRDGFLWSSGVGPTGHYVVISTRKPIAVFMVHMRSLYVPTGVERGAGRIAIKAGQPIGVVSYSPRDGQKLNHLHFEIWRGGGSSSAVDPTQYLKGAIRS